MKEPQKLLVKSEKELENIAENLVNNLPKERDGAGVIALYGDLGSGKTTFTKEIANYFEIKETITSPTFVILKRFEINPEFSKGTGFKNLIHIDTYRLDLAEELHRLGFEEILNDKNNLVVIEWPEIIEGSLPKETIRVYFSFIDESTRELEIKFN